MEGTRKRFWIVSAALTLGGLGLILATVFYAFETVDHRAQVLAPPRMTAQPDAANETIDSAAASRAAPDPMPVTQQTATGQTAPVPDLVPATQQTTTGQTATVPDSMPNTQQNVHRNAHHAHGSRFARRHRHR